MPKLQFLSIWPYDQSSATPPMDLFLCWTQQLISPTSVQLHLFLFTKKAKTLSVDSILLQSHLSLDIEHSKQVVGQNHLCCEKGKKIYMSYIWYICVKKRQKDICVMSVAHQARIYWLLRERTDDGWIQTPYSLVRLVVPNTEELNSWPFMGLLKIQWLLQDCIRT